MASFVSKVCGGVQSRENQRSSLEFCISSKPEVQSWKNQRPSLDLKSSSSYKPERPVQATNGEVQFKLTSQRGQVSGISKLQSPECKPGVHSIGKFSITKVNRPGAHPN